MPRFALLVGAAAVLAATAPLAAAATASAAPQAPAVTCGTHYVQIDISGYDEYWGNCGTANTKVTYHNQVIFSGVHDLPNQTVCAPAGQDVLLGYAQIRFGEGHRYVVADASGTC